MLFNFKFAYFSMFYNNGILYLTSQDNSNVFLTTPVNRNGKNITVSPKRAKKLTFNRKSYYPIKTFLLVLLVQLAGKRRPNMT